MKCCECKFCGRDQDSKVFRCRNPYSPRYDLLSDVNNIGEYGCVFGQLISPSEAPTTIFTEPKIELYSVVCKIDTGVDYTHKEYLVNTTSQERALELVMEYFKNTSHSDEAIVGDPIVHVLRKEGIVDSHQVGCY